MHGAYPHQDGERVVHDIFKLEKEKKPQPTSEQQYNHCEQKNKWTLIFNSSASHIPYSYPYHVKEGGWRGWSRAICAAALFALLFWDFSTLHSCNESYGTLIPFQMALHPSLPPSLPGRSILATGFQRCKRTVDGWRDRQAATLIFIGYQEKKKKKGCVFNKIFQVTFSSIFLFLSV